MGCARQQASSGFTLLELLVAIFIFAMVFAALYEAYITTFSMTGSVESQADIDTRARTAMQRITADLKSAYLGDGGRFSERKRVISGKRDDLLEFTSTDHLSFNPQAVPAGFALIRYSVATDPKTGLLQLFRLDIPYRPGFLDKEYTGEKGYLLCDGLRAVRFICVDREGNQMENWPGEDRTAVPDSVWVKAPTLMFVVLRFADPGRSDLVFKTAVALPPQNFKRAGKPEHG